MVWGVSTDRRAPAKKFQHLSSNTKWLIDNNEIKIKSSRVVFQHTLLKGHHI